MSNPEPLPIPFASSLVPESKGVGDFLTLSLLSLARYLESGPGSPETPYESLARVPKGEEDLYPPPFRPPNVEITGCPGSISIKLGENAAATHLTPVEQLHFLSRSLFVPGEPFKVVAGFEIGAWSKYGGFCNLGQYLDVLGDEVSFKHWEALTIRLPNDDLLYDMTYQIPEYALENLRHLDWSGHREQLANSWLPFTPPLLQSLSTLVIMCNIALEDCSCLFLFGKQLNHFELHSIQPGVDPILLDKPAETDPKDRERLYLETLTLTSLQDINPLLSLFRFPALSAISFNLWYPTTDLVALPINWENLKKVTLRNISDDDSRQIEEACGADTRHEHTSYLRLNL